MFGYPFSEGDAHIIIYFFPATVKYFSVVSAKKHCWVGELGELVGFIWWSKLLFNHCLMELSFLRSFVLKDRLWQFVCGWHQCIYSLVMCERSPQKGREKLPKIPIICSSMKQCLLLQEHRLVMLKLHLLCGFEECLFCFNVGKSVPLNSIWCRVFSLKNPNFLS